MVSPVGPAVPIHPFKPALMSRTNCNRSKFPTKVILLRSELCLLGSEQAQYRTRPCCNRVISRPAIVLQVPTPHIARHGQAAACPRAARKSATYRSPWSPHRQLCCHRQAKYTVQIVRFRERVAKAPAPRSIRRLRAASGSLVQIALQGQPKVS